MLVAAFPDVGNYGFPLADVRTDGTLASAGTGTVMKLLVAPVVGLVVAPALKFADPTVAWTFVLTAGGPTAVTTIVLVGAFGSDGRAGSSVAPCSWPRSRAS